MEQPVHIHWTDYENRGTPEDGSYTGPGVFLDKVVYIEQERSGLVRLPDGETIYFPLYSIKFESRDSEDDTHPPKQ